MLFDGVLGFLEKALRFVNVVLKIVGSRSNPPKDRKRVVILGGSFAGLAVQRELSDEFEVTVVDVRNYFEYTPGILRAFVEPEYLAAMVCPIPSKRNKFVQAQVSGVSSSSSSVSVTYPDGSSGEIPYDYLLVATGSSYEAPIKPVFKESSLESRTQTIQAAASKLKAATTVLIIGAGPVGVELAGEVVTKYPEKKVILVDGASEACALFPKRSKDYIDKWLRKKGVQLELGVPIAGKFPQLEITSNGCTLADGKELKADIVYKCIGIKVETEFMKSFGEIAVDRRGSIRVNDHLQVEGHTNVFALGDCMLRTSEVEGTAIREAKLAHTAEVNGHMVAKNVMLLSKQQPLLQYPQGITGGIPTPLVFCVSLGKYDGTLGMNWMVVNGGVTGIFKWLLEWTKVMAIQEEPIGTLFWKISDKASFLLCKYFFKRE